MYKLLIIFSLSLLFGCQKAAVDKPPVLTEDSVIVDNGPAYIKYTILKGQHYCDRSTIRSFSGDQINFKVKFDSTAIYKAINRDNQEDINKLYGITEGIDNHTNSARIGWSWNNNALHLYAYAYAGGERGFKEISTVAIGAEITCNITISGKYYLFAVNDKKVELARSLTGAPVSGYWQFPYFGGDEVAQHNTYIYILDFKK